MFEILLFVAGDTDLSRRAIRNLETLCTGDLSGRCRFDVVDILQDRTAARQHRIIATPLAMRIQPLPQRKVIGDLSDTDRFYDGLGIARS